PLPPLKEQLEICNFLAAELATSNTAISRLEREIELLREYRTRLVADVVTGKLDVRAVAARLPDEAEPTADETTSADDEDSDDVSEAEDAAA
ncbi:MAG: restriction endonuclease subunit S, partial [Burkholderiales bacterium]